MNIHARGTDPHEPLEAVLRAATVAAHPEELAGEQAAVVAFRAAAGVTAVRKRSFLARVLTVKALVVGSVAVSTGVVLAAVGGALPIPGIGPANTPDPPSVTVPGSVPTGTPADGPTTTTDEPTGQPTSPPPSSAEPCDDCPDDGRHDKPGDDDRSGPGKKKDDKHEDERQGDQPQTEPTNETDQTNETNELTLPSAKTTQTPDSPAQGAVTAVPPNGAEPPSPGG